MIRTTKTREPLKTRKARKLFISRWADGGTNPRSRMSTKQAAREIIDVFGSNWAA